MVSCISNEPPNLAEVTEVGRAGGQVIDESRPIFMQIAELIENDIVDGALAEEAQVPSTNEFAAFYRINPATAAKGVNRLVDEGVMTREEADYYTVCKRILGRGVAKARRNHRVAGRVP